MTNSSDSNKDKDLIQLLVDQKIISAAQAELAKADHEVTGMTLAEVFLARRWVSEETLERVAPWLKDAPRAVPTVVTAPEKSTRGIHETDGYQQNLKRYRQIMHKILDE